MTADAGRPDTILVVEDNPGDVRLIEEAFSDPRFETTLHAVSTGERALDFVNRRGDYENAPEPDVVLLGWNLPKMAGEDVLDGIKTDFSHVPVVVMTGTEAEIEAIEPVDVRPDAYLTKPSDPTEYVEAVDSVY